jgi:hypothetical protein
MTTTTRLQARSKLIPSHPFLIHLQKHRPTDLQSLLSGAISLSLDRPCLSTGLQSLLPGATSSSWNRPWAARIVLVSSKVGLECDLTTSLSSPAHLQDHRPAFRQSLLPCAGCALFAFHWQRPVRFVLVTTYWRIRPSWIWIVISGSRRSFCISIDNPGEYGYQFCLACICSFSCISPRRHSVFCNLCRLPAPDASRTPPQFRLHLLISP